MLKDVAFFVVCCHDNSQCSQWFVGYNIQSLVCVKKNTSTVQQENKIKINKHHTQTQTNRHLAIYVMVVWRSDAARQRYKAEIIAAVGHHVVGFVSMLPHVWCLLPYVFMVKFLRLHYSVSLSFVFSIMNGCISYVENSSEIVLNSI